MITPVCKASDILVITRGETAAIVLPKLQLGALRFGGLFLILFGLVFAGFPLGLVLRMSGLLGGGQGAPLLMTALVVVFIIPFVAGGFVPLFIGLFVLARGPFKLQLTPRHIRSVMHAGPLRWSRKRRLDVLTGLRVTEGVSREAPQMSALSGAALLADCSKGKPLLLAAGYPQEILLAAANALVEELHRRNYTQVLRPGTAGAPLPAVHVETPPPSDAAETGSLGAADAAERPAVEKPANSAITCVATGGCLTFMIPRSGFRGAARFFLGFAILWNAIAGTIFAVMLREFIRQPGLDNVFGLLFILVFIAIGIGTVLIAIQLAYRKAVILATHESLVITQKGPVRDREFQWTADQLAAIRREHSGTKINDRPLSELRVYTKNSEHKGFFDGRDEAELEWLAGSLRDFYWASPGESR